MKSKSLRAVVKGLSWRAFAAFDTAVVATVVMFYRTGHFDATNVLGLVAGIVGMELLTKTFLFAIHERLWERERVPSSDREEQVEPRPTWEQITERMRRDYGVSRLGLGEAVE